MSLGLLGAYWAAGAQEGRTLWTPPAVLPADEIPPPVLLPLHGKADQSSPPLPDGMKPKLDANENVPTGLQSVPAPVPLERGTASAGGKTGVVVEEGAGIRLVGGTLPAPPVPAVGLPPVGLPVDPATPAGPSLPLPVPMFPALPPPAPASPSVPPPLPAPAPPSVPSPLPAPALQNTPPPLPARANSSYQNAHCRSVAEERAAARSFAAGPTTRSEGDNAAAGFASRAGKGIYGSRAGAGSARREPGRSVQGVRANSSGRFAVRARAESSLSRHDAAGVTRQLAAGDGRPGIHQGVRRYRNLRDGGAGASRWRAGEFAHSGCDCGKTWGSVFARR